MENIMHKILIINRLFRFYRNHMTEDMNIKNADCQYLMCAYYHVGITQDQMAEHLCVDKSAVARKLSALEEQGYITRSPMPADKRNLQIYITEKTEKLIPAIIDINRHWSDYILSDLTQDDMDKFTEILDKIKTKAENWQNFDFENMTDREEK